jgi:hypothetical protein
MGASDCHVPVRFPYFPKCLAICGPCTQVLGYLGMHPHVFKSLGIWGCITMCSSYGVSGDASPICPSTWVSGDASPYTQVLGYMGPTPKADFGTPGPWQATQRPPTNVKRKAVIHNRICTLHMHVRSVTEATLKLKTDTCAIILLSSVPPYHHMCSFRTKHRFSQTRGQILKHIPQICART